MLVSIRGCKFLMTLTHLQILSYWHLFQWSKVCWGLSGTVWGLSWAFLLLFWMLCHIPLSNQILCSFSGVSGLGASSLKMMEWISGNSLAVQGMHVLCWHFLVPLSSRFLLSSQVMFWYLRSWWYDLGIVSRFDKIRILRVSVSLWIWEIIRKLVWCGPDVLFLCTMLSACCPCSFLQSHPGHLRCPAWVLSSMKVIVLIWMVPLSTQTYPGVLWMCFSLPHLVIVWVHGMHLYSLLQPHIHNGIKKEVPVTFISYNFTGTQQAWSATEWELYAIYVALHKLSYMIKGGRVTIGTGHKPLLEIVAGTAKSQNSAAADKFRCWTSDILTGDPHPTIQYKKGSLNLIADSLWRLRIGEHYKYDEPLHNAKPLILKKKVEINMVTKRAKSAE